MGASRFVYDLLQALLVHWENGRCPRIPADHWFLRDRFSQLKRPTKHLVDLKPSVVSIQLSADALTLGTIIVLPSVVALMVNPQWGVVVGCVVLVGQIVAVRRVSATVEGDVLVVRNRIRTHQFGPGSKVVSKRYMFNSKGLPQLFIRAPSGRAAPVLAACRMSGPGDMEARRWLDRALKSL